jgi:hypothetical protein
MGESILPRPSGWGFGQILGVMVIAMPVVIGTLGLGTKHWQLLPQLCEHANRRRRVGAVGAALCYPDATEPRPISFAAQLIHSLLYA